MFVLQESAINYFHCSTLYTPSCPAKEADSMRGGTSNN